MVQKSVEVLRRNGVFIVIFSVIGFISFAAYQTGNLIFWTSEKKLSWSDFKGTPNPKSSYFAFTESGIKADLESKDDSVFINVRTYFDKQSSWTKDIKNESLLQHEQLHFQITELFARKFRKELSETKFTMKQLSDELHKIHGRVFSDCREMQARYDKETNHSIIKEKQAEWNKKVQTELESLSNWSKTLVRAKISS